MKPTEEKIQQLADHLTKRFPTAFIRANEAGFPNIFMVTGAFRVVGSWDNVRGKWKATMYVTAIDDGLTDDSDIRHLCNQLTDAVVAHNYVASL